MLIAILILTIFNTGLILLVMGAVGMALKEIEKAVKEINRNTDHDTESALTAIYNMDSLKQKVKMNGSVDLP